MNGKGIIRGGPLDHRLGSRRITFVRNDLILVRKGNVTIGSDDAPETTVTRIHVRDEKVLQLAPHDESVNAADCRLRQKRALSVLDAWAVVLPARVVNEDLGDYIEDIHNRIAAGQAWKPRIRLFAAIVWTCINALGYTVKDLLGRKSTK